MTAPAEAWLADLEARALAVLPEVMASMLNHQGWPTGDARAFSKAKARKFRFHIDGDTAEWVEGAGHKVEQRGVGVVAIVGFITALPPDKAAEALATILTRIGIAVDDRPLTEPTLIREYRDIRTVFQRRRRDLGLSMEQLGEAAGIPDRYAAKVLNGIRHLGPISLPSILGALKLRMWIEPIDEAA